MKRILFIVLCLLSYSSYSNSIDLNIDSSYMDEDCKSDIEGCFLSGIDSVIPNKIIRSVLIYVDNYTLLSEKFSSDKVISALKKVSKLGNLDALHLEASVYYVGNIVERDVNKSIDLLESIKYDERNSVTFNLLGKFYLYKLNTEKSEYLKNEYFKLSKDNFYRAHLLNDIDSTRALAIVMLKYGGSEDYFEAGKLLKYLSNVGDEEDAKRYEKYKSIKRKN
ncbi:hypothetical protein [Vibrio coralliilyticus]|uniref:hypothetical protein n=1 Tax=Vibrio coralliilyticus TaxID=190893 RepID=UPI00148BA7AD|nr:hypothetical protein [Vibrio coralliilyticus]NOI30620.1 hypothetical protein [Vibrio coralliilyticus]NOI49832.1 hypothetical protein [Vibrio coralliilyticus]